jgi:myo-inositol-1(or 4)-monophosphatase
VNPELKRYLDVARDAALASGQSLRQSFGLVHQVTYKNKVDPVTTADLEAEALILDVLSQQFPTHSILSEETGDINKGSAFRWIVDPLDGTSNFLHGVPHFGVSIALFKSNSPIIGVIYDPMANELYTTVRGFGAFLNKTRLEVSTVKHLLKGMFGTGFSTSPKALRQQYLTLGKIITHCGAIREPGSAALGLCYVSRGIYDGYWESGLQLWDVAAGMLLVAEAGGVVSNLDGTPATCWSGSILASNSGLHSVMLHILGALE